MRCYVHRAAGEPHLHFVRIRIIDLNDLKERNVEGSGSRRHLPT